MQGEYTITTTRKMIILDGLRNPVDGYHISFYWTDDQGTVRNSNIKIDARSASSEQVDAAIRAEIEKVESWLR